MKKHNPKNNTRRGSINSPLRSPKCHPEIEYTEGEERANLRDHLFGAVSSQDCFIGITIHLVPPKGVIPKPQTKRGNTLANLRDHLFGAYINSDCFVGRKKHLSNYSN